MTVLLEGVTTKVCRRCDTEKSVDEFYRNRRAKDGRYSYCKPCSHLTNNEWRDRNPERAKAHARKSVSTQRGLTARQKRSRRYHYRVKYGITPEEFDTMVEAQGGLCALCDRPPPGEGKGKTRLHVDHDHETGRLRRLLCNPCNIALGLLGDDPERLRRAAEYIEEFQ